MGQIVCAIDESAGANRALTVADELARDLNAPLTLLHVMPSPASDALSVADVRRPELELEEARALFAAAHQRLRGGAAATRVEFGSPADELIRVAAEDSTQMLVLGARGRGGLASAVLGSVSREVADGARCPVLVVPPAGEPLPSDPPALAVVCGVEGARQDRHVMEVARELAQRLGLSLHVVSAATPVVVAAPAPVPPVNTLDPTAIRREQLEQELADAGFGAEVHVTYGPAHEALERVAEIERARLLVVGSRGRGVLRRLLTGTVSGRLVANAERPVLIVSDPAAPASSPSNGV